MAAFGAEYGAEVDFDSLPGLLATHQLVFPGGPPPG